MKTYFIYFFLSPTYFTKGRTDPLEKQLDPVLIPCEAIGPPGSIPAFLRKRIATCNFPGGGGSGAPVPHPTPLDLSINHRLRKDQLQPPGVGYL